uniref:Uncharacterized protein n=1 Tax=Anguilla anguilla TaxID=7936 RepID=A0A0E9WCV7_ANGAN
MIHSLTLILFYISDFFPPSHSVCAEVPSPGFAPVHAASSSPWCLFHALASVE